MNESWSTAPLVFVIRPACPVCGSTDYVRTRTDDNGDGSATKKVICKGCGGRYKIILESPETGKAELEPAIMSACHQPFIPQGR